MSVETLERPAGEAVRKAPVLVLDVDHALLRTDLLHESTISFLKANPLRIFLIIAWLMQGRAVLKRKLAEVATIDFGVLPVTDELVAYAREQHAAGRKVGLATAADSLLAEALAQRFDFIDFVLASDGQRNLKGSAKGEAIVERFGNDFAYAADSRSDLHVWGKAAGIILVNAKPATARAAKALGKPVEAEFTRVRPGLKGWLNALRVHQWAKNVLIFVPLILGGLFMQPQAWVQAGLAFVALSLMASSTYLINDLWDIEDDRRHWTKRNRPLASGRMTIKQAVILAPLLLVASFVLGATVGVGVVLALMAYLVLTLGYSFAFKRKPVLDTFVLATLFTLRLVIGIAATGTMPSPWLLVFSMFLFTSLSFAKRLTEVLRYAEKQLDAASKVSGRGYFIMDTPFILNMGVASGMASILIMVLYLNQDAFLVDFYSNSVWLWVIPAMLFLWLSRIWMIAQRGELMDDPVVFATRDPKSLMLCAAVVAAFVLAVVELPF